MKHLRLAAASILILVIALTSFAAGGPSRILKSTESMEKPALKRKIGNSRGTRRTPVIRLRRVTDRQRRKFFRRMLDIYIN